MKLTIIPVQSVTDLITNSSSEVFILDTDKTCEQVNKVLEGITTGFRFPEIFHLKEYREWRRKIDNGELEVEYSYPGTIFTIVKEWFFDPKNEEDMYNFKKDFLFMPWCKDFGFKSYCSNTFLPVQKAFMEYINNNWDTFKEYLSNISAPLNKESFLQNEWQLHSLPDCYVKEFIDNYKEPVYGWELEPKDNVENLNGKILVVSTDDNSIPYDTWDSIYMNFKGFNKHLG